MAVKIGSARSSYGSPQAGDQHGGMEVSTQSWYLHSKGWYVYRAKDTAQREKIAVAMERACANNNIGYSQPTRNTLYANIKDKGFDPAKTTKAVNTDCSALVRVCCNYAGIPVGDFITSNEGSALMATGAFDKYTDADHCKSSAYLMRGDILCTRSKGHTVVVLSNGAKAAKNSANANTSTANAKCVRITGKTVNIRSGAGANYKDVGDVHAGETYELVSKTNGWYQIRVNGKIVWVSGKYAKEV